MPRFRRRPRDRGLLEHPREQVHGTPRSLVDRVGARKAMRSARRAPARPGHRARRPRGCGRSRPPAYDPGISASSHRGPRWPIPPRWRPARPRRNSRTMEDTVPVASPVARAISAWVSFGSRPRRSVPRTSTRCWLAVRSGPSTRGGAVRVGRASRRGDHMAALSNLALSGQKPRHNCRACNLKTISRSTLHGKAVTREHFAERSAAAGRSSATSQEKPVTPHSSRLRRRVRGCTRRREPGRLRQLRRGQQRLIRQQHQDHGRLQARQPAHRAAPRHPRRGRPARRAARSGASFPTPRPRRATRCTTPRC